MENVFIYLLKVNGLLLFFWIFYKLLLQKETFYKYNRFYFLGSIVLSFVFPLIHYTKIQEIIISTSNLKTVQDNSNFVLNSTEIIKTNWYETIDWFLISLAIVGIISIIKIVIRIFKINQLVHSIKSFENHPTEKNIKISANNQQVYSFYKWMVLPKQLFNNENISVLIAHENIHIKQKHSFDLVFIGLVNDLFWFNPIIKLIRKDINLNLEFLVDEEITKQENSYQYQKTLLNFNQNIETNLLTNAFNSSDLKKRILMLNSKKSNPMKKLKIALTAPVLLAFFGLFQIETIAQVKQETQKNEIVTESIEVEEIYEVVPVYEEIVVEETNGYDKNETSFYIVVHSSYDDIYFFNMKKNLKETFNLDIEISDLKRNKNGELTSIDITCKDKNQYFKKQIIADRDKPFVPFKLNIYKKDNQYYIQNVENKFKGRFNFDSTSDSLSSENELIKTEIENKKNLATTTENILYIIDDKEVDSSDLGKISPNEIKNITVLKDDESIKKYGEKGKNGVLIIQTKEYKKKELEENQKALNERKKAEIESKKALAESKRAEIESKKALAESKKAEIESKKALAESKRAEIESKKALIESNKAERERQKAVIEEQKALIEKRKSTIETKKAAIEKRKALAEENKNFDLINTLFNDVKVDVKKLEDDDFKITSISASLTKEDGTKISISEKY